MKKPAVVVFDLGKVLVDFDYSIAAGRLAARSKVDAKGIQAFIDHSPLLVRYEKGKISRAAFFEEVRRITSCRCSLEEFGEMFGNVFTPIEPMIQLQQELRQAGVPTYIFSNTNDLAVEYISANFPFYAGFDGYVLSYEHGAMKPEPALYEAVERLTGRAGAELLYFDDRAENTEAARVRGWRGVTHVNPDASREVATSLGLLPG